MIDDVLVIERRSFGGGEHQPVRTVRRGQAMLFESVDGHRCQRNLALASGRFRCTSFAPSVDALLDRDNTLLQVDIVPAKATKL